MTANSPPSTPHSGLRRVCTWITKVLLGAFVLLLLFFLGVWAFPGRVPKSYPASQHPLEPVWAATPSANSPAGFDSPYLGHNESWDGKGGGKFGSSKAN